MQPTPPIILFLTSTSRHFPLDLQELLVNEGHEARRYPSLDDFLSCPDRHTPYLAVLEIGSADDLDRAALAYEWCEKIQPIAACRTLLLFASKNIRLGEHAARFGTAEIAQLPLPIKNLMFKIDLQLRLLISDQNQAAAERGNRPVSAGAGISALLAERPPKSECVLLVRGLGPKRGFWQEAAESPMGKVRWRWVNTPSRGEEPTEAEKAGVSWVAESRAKPVYEEETDAWTLDDPEAELFGFRQDKQIYSARTSLRRPARAKAEDELSGSHGAGDGNEAEASFGAEAQSIARAKSAKLGSAADGAPAGAGIGAGNAGAKGGTKAGPPGAQETINASRAGSADAGSKKFAEDKAPPSGQRQRIYTDAPAWNDHINLSPDAIDSRPGSEPTQAPAPPNAPKKAPQAKAGGNAENIRPAAAPAMDAPTGPERAGEPVDGNSIPAHYQGEEEDDGGGYSVPVNTEGSQSEGTGAESEPEAMRCEAEQNSASTYAARRGGPAGPSEISRIHQDRTPTEEAQNRHVDRAEEAAEANPAERSQGQRERNAPVAASCTGQRRDSAPEAARPRDASAGGVREEPGPGRAPEADASGPIGAKPMGEQQAQFAPSSAREGGASAPAQGSSKSAGAASSETHIASDPGHAANPSGVVISASPGAKLEEIRVGGQGEEPYRRPDAKGESENFLKYRHFVTMTLEELSDRESSWHPVNRFRIYLAASHRYYGVKDPAELVPAWVYEGELAPEFLEEKKAWKFYDRYPELYSTLDTLPPAVLDHFYVMAGKPPLRLAETLAAARARAAGPGAAESEPGAPAMAPAPGSAAVAPGGLWGSVVGLVRRLLGRK